MAQRVATFGLAILIAGAAPQAPTQDGFVSLFNGSDLTGWKVPEGDNGHWKVVNGVIDYDARSEAKGARDLVSEKEYGNFILKLEWRITATPWITSTSLTSCRTARTPGGSMARS